MSDKNGTKSYVVYVPDEIVKKAKHIILDRGIILGELYAEAISYYVRMIESQQRGMRP